MLSASKLLVYGGRAGDGRYVCGAGGSLANSLMRHDLRTYVCLYCIVITTTHDSSKVRQYSLVIDTACFNT